MIEWTPIISTSIAALITATFALLGVLAKIAVNAMQAVSNSFIDYLKAQAEKDRLEREAYRQTLEEHTIISRDIYHAQGDHTKAITDLTQQVSRIVERLDRMESRRIT